MEVEILELVSKSGPLAIICLYLVWVQNTTFRALTKAIGEQTAAVSRLTDRLSMMRVSKLKDAGE